MSGSAVMNNTGSIVMDNCDVDSESFYGLINKSSGTSGFFASVRASRFTGSLWHISAGADLTTEDEEALLAPNEFLEEEENVTRNTTEWTKGIVQPWRRGCLQRVPRKLKGRGAGAGAGTTAGAGAAL
jgi:hypothetical protein